MFIKVTHKGDWKETESFLTDSQKKMSTIESVLHKYGQKGVDALSRNTPQNTGKTAMSWRYKVTTNQWGYDIEWYNTNGNVAILIQYGHGTGTGGYVQAIDYINPAMKPIFEGLAEEMWKEVSRL